MSQCRKQEKANKNDECHKAGSERMNNITFLFDIQNNRNRTKDINNGKEYHKGTCNLEKTEIHTIRNNDFTNANVSLFKLIERFFIHYFSFSCFGHKKCKK